MLALGDYTYENGVIFDPSGRVHRDLVMCIDTLVWDTAKTLAYLRLHNEVPPNPILYNFPAGVSYHPGLDYPWRVTSAYQSLAELFADFKHMQTDHIGLYVTDPDAPERQSFLLLYGYDPYLGIFYRMDGKDVDLAYSLDPRVAVKYTHIPGRAYPALMFRDKPYNLHKLVVWYMTGHWPYSTKFIGTDPMRCRPCDIAVKFKHEEDYRSLISAEKVQFLRDLETDKQVLSTLQNAYGSV